MSIDIYVLLLFCLVTEVVLEVKVEQKDLSMTKREDKTVSISCKVPGLSDSDYVHWYQKKEGEALTRILYVKGDGQAVYDTNHPDAKEFEVRIQSDHIFLKIPKLKKSHSAVYYCAIWDVKIFGSGTRLYVTDTAKVPPTISVYPVSNKQEEGQHVLLCQAKNMFPDLVKFTWLDSKGGEVKSSDDGDEQLEQIDSVGTTSMLILEKNKVTSYEYTCIVKHEGEEQNKLFQQLKLLQPSVCPDKKHRRRKL
ncbi:immunoglobulin lambda-1 light chain-like [Silurus meridionalis]|uniref:immunoglobulin lambda-1 light chain-like n=1 Tax=Silurus meridionalis TaxID=175797 RepID=UPI001EEA34E6|nr:immunoglobulin lambda-1 light chain-like [Silurus meridionalis]